ncbi:hypothetical protein [Desulfosporosinus nitroreducens]|uniref:Peptidase C39-like domain-containing protein n=1 Tax=Desulfosporosinus nitroreducens TaxID=2018668 RepID=A0ABT8QRA1_9FIRM|nr:hypothetical protein [Desulfosporosinus nitroreducens]MCO1603047.1 hypothetical protein [Desulfosporosinus nitroreducens]MDO0823835.1 hypothetical protein [Desulfosporosinus nitroreducens]
MTAKHLGYNKKISLVFIIVTALLISGIVVYTGMFGAETTSKETALVKNQNELSDEVTSVEASIDTNEGTEQETTEVIEPIAKPVIVQPKPTMQESPLPFNQLVLAQIKTYNKGSYPYLLNNDYANYNGVTSNLYYQEKLLLKAHPNGTRASHCVGITFEVFFNAMKEWNQQQGYAGDTIKDLSYEQFYDFILKWYVAGPKTENNLVIALEKYQLGKRLTNFEEARPGDFIDFSRENQTGHTVVLIDWVRVNGKIVGLRYWSSQESTNGIGYKTEYFNILRSDGTKYGTIMKDKIHIGRVVPL